MLTFHSYEGKNLDNLKLTCEEELKGQEILFHVIEEEAGLFKGKKYILEAISKEEIKEYIKNFINDLSKNFNININSEVRFEDNLVKIMLVSDNNNIIIGYNGKNLDAIQVIIRQATKNLSKFDLKVLVDASNYKNKKNKSLEFEIKKICKDVIKTKVEVKLDPMNSYQRRIVHSIVSEFDELCSESFGEDPNRYTVIKVRN